MPRPYVHRFEACAPSRAPSQGMPGEGAPRQTRRYAIERMAWRLLNHDIEFARSEAMTLTDNPCTALEAARSPDKDGIKRAFYRNLFNVQGKPPALATQHDAGSCRAATHRLAAGVRHVLGATQGHAVGLHHGRQDLLAGVHT